LQGGTVNARLGAGAITVSGGTTTLGSAGRLNTSATLAVNGGQLSLGGAETVAALSGSAGTVALGAHALTFGGNNANTSYSGTITGAGGALTKSGTGTATLSGNNTYTGATTISGGRLVVNGAQSSSAVTVDSGAALGGSGAVGDLTVSGLLAPGNSIGTLSASNTTFNGGGAFELEMFDWTGSAGTGWDLLANTGDLTLSNTAGNKFTINLVSLQNSTDPGSSINLDQTLIFTNTFVTYAGSLLGTEFSNDLFTVNTSGFQNVFAGTFSITNISEGLALVYTAPELGDEFTWDAGSGNWSTGGNWTNNAAPSATGAKIYYSGTNGGLSTNNNEATAVIGLTFKDGAGAYTVAGNSLTLGALGIANDSSSIQTVDVALTLDGSLAFNAASEGLVINGSVALGTNTLTVAGNAATTIGGAIGGAGSLTKAGNGTLALGGANNYSGGTLVTAGTLVGTTTSLQGGITNDASVTFSQSTNGTYGGVMVGTGSLIKTGSGSVTLAGNNTFSGILAANGGGLVIEGTQAATTVNVNGGTILLGANNVLADGATLTLTTGTVGQLYLAQLGYRLPCVIAYCTSAHAASMDFTVFGGLPMKGFFLITVMGRQTMNDRSALAP
jgi:autotransporter-associated beta strand protein